MAEIRFSLFPEQRSCKIQHRTIAINRYFDGRFTPHRGSFACLIYRDALFYFEFQNYALSLQANSNEPGDRPVFENHIEQHNNMQDLKALEEKSRRLRQNAKFCKFVFIKILLCKKNKLFTP